MSKNNKNQWDKYVPIVEDKGTTYVYLTSPIADIINYNKLIHMLITAKEGSKVELIICTPGGDVDAGMSIRNAVKASKATVIGRLTGTVASAGTMIALSCDDLIVEPNLSFMCHEVSLANIQGKFSDVHTMQDFYKNQFSKMSKDVYGGFLSDEEIDRMHQGKELWFNDFQVIERWANKNMIKEDENECTEPF